MINLKYPSATAIAFLIICFMLGLALLSFANIPLTPYAFDETSRQTLSNPSWTHPMGTDELGRDLLSRIFYGSRLSIMIGVVTALVAVAFGTTYGAVAGYCEGQLDALLMRGIDLAYSIPDLLVMILIGIVVGRGTAGILIALGLVSWMGTARLVRAQILQLKHEEFIDAARAVGLNPLGIIIRHLLPNAIGIILVAVTFTVPSAIIAESTLSFIGLGLSPPACSWGTLASQGLRAIRTHPHLIAFPGLFILITVLSFNLLGDGLRDLFDPHHCGRHSR